MGNFQNVSGGFQPILLVCKEVPQSLCAGASLPLRVDTTSSDRSTLKQELRGLQFCSCAQEGVGKNVSAFPWMEQSLRRCCHGVSALAAPSDLPWGDNATDPPADRLLLHGETRPSYLMACFWPG